MFESIFLCINFNIYHWLFFFLLCVKVATVKLLKNSRERKKTLICFIFYVHGKGKQLDVLWIYMLVIRSQNHVYWSVRSNSTDKY
jgi:hypothetical protein